MSDDKDVVDLAAWLRHKHGLLSDVDARQAVIVTDRASGRIDAILWVRDGLDPDEESAVIQVALDERFPEGY
jgi:hypothetical protein